MRLGSAILMLATLAMVADSSRQQKPPAVAPSPISIAPAPSENCDSVMFDMSDCLPYLGNGSVEKKPTSACCNGFLIVFDFSPDCVCEGTNFAIIEMGLTLNMTRAKALPGICGVKLPPFKHCKVVDQPPSATPAGPPDSPKLPPKSTPGNPPTSPSTEPPSAEPSSEGSAPSKTPSTKAPSPSKGGAYSVSISIVVLISCMLFHPLFLA